MSPRSVSLSFLICLALRIASSAWSAPPEKQRTDRYGDPLPPGAVARMGSVLFFHEQAPSVLAYSPDGKILAIAGITASPFSILHGSVRLLDAATGKQLRQLPGHTFTHALRFSPDGKFLISSGSEWDGLGDRTKIWDVATGREPHRLKGNDLTRDGKTSILVVPEEDTTTIRFSEVATGKLLREITVPHGLRSKHVVIAPDHKTLSGGTEKAVYLWDAANGKELHCLSHSKKYVSWLAYSPDGKTLAACFGDNTVKLWEVASGKELHRWDGFHSGAGNTAAFSPNGKMLAVPCNDEKIRLWNTETGKEVTQINVPHFAHLGVAFAPDGKTLAWGARGRHEGSWVHLWDLASGKERRPPGRLPGAVNVVAFSPDGKTLMSASSRPSYRSPSRDPLRFWETVTGKELRQFTGPADCWSTAVSPARHLWATTGEKLQLWDSVAGKEIALHGQLPEYAEVLAFSPDGRLLAVAAERTLRLWNTTKGEEYRSLGKLRENPYTIGFTADGKQLLTRFFDKDGPAIKVWDVATGKIIRKLRDPGMFGIVPASTAISSDGRMIAVISCKFDERDQQRLQPLDVWVVVWDLIKDQLIRELRVDHPSPAWRGFVIDPRVVTAIAFSPDSRSLACAYRGGGNIRLWEVATGQERHRFEGHRQVVHCLAFSADGSLLATGSDDHTALVWDLFGRLDNGPPGETDLSAEQVRSLWTDLRAKDARVAYRAMCRLLSGKQTVSFLKTQLPPIAALDARQREQVSRWIADLDSAQFDSREKAARELEKLGDLVEPALRAALANKPSLEVRNRIKPILEKLEPSRLPQRMQALRAVEVLEHLATPEAMELLRTLAGGAPSHQLTREAKSTLQRLARKPPRSGEDR